MGNRKSGVSGTPPTPSGQRTVDTEIPEDELFPGTRVLVGYWWFDPPRHQG